MRISYLICFSLLTILLGSCIKDKKTDSTSGGLVYSYGLNVRLVDSVGNNLFPHTDSLGLSYPFDPQNSYITNGLNEKFSLLESQRDMIGKIFFIGIQSSSVVLESQALDTNYLQWTVHYDDPSTVDTLIWVLDPDFTNRQPLRVLYNSKVLHESNNPSFPFEFPLEPFNIVLYE